MSLTKEYNTRICIYHENKIYKLFTIGYHKDGGYFIGDLSNPKGYHYLASKIRAPGGTKAGETLNIPVDSNNSYTISVNNPKISHHIDGNSHISGVGIRSGYELNGAPKGLSNKAGRLFDRNDGGPLFCFTIGLGALSFFPVLSIENDADLNKIYKKRHLILNKEILVDMTSPSDSNYKYNIEGFIILKCDLPKGYKGELLYKIHPLYQIIQLFPLPSPVESPYILALGYIKEPEWLDPIFFSYGAAPGYPESDGGYTMLTMCMRKNKPESDNILPSLNLET